MNSRRLIDRLATVCKDYKYRFAPTLFVRILRTDLAKIPKVVEVPTEEIDRQLRCALQALTDRFHALNFHRNPRPEDCASATVLLREHLGFELCRKESTIPECGKGVFLSSGSVEAGRVMCMYPGTVYDPWDSLFFQSIANQFVLKCADGVAIDGNDRRLSKFIFRSCARRDLSPFVCDLSWMSANSFNFLALGQYVNNAKTLDGHNVQYMDIDVKGWPFALRKFLPYAVYSPTRDALLRVVVLVSTRRIEQGEELFSAYISR